MLKEDYPIYFDDTEISIRDRRWNRSYINVTSIFQTEDGHDDVEVIRTGKSTISAAFRCTDAWASVFASFNSHTSINVRFYDVETNDYITLIMRMDGLMVNKIVGSERLSVTNGTYEVTFNLVEF
jgi:hypothetical protein